MEATELLSFEKLSLQLGKGLSVLVGPNGSGKSNLVRILGLAVAAANAAGKGDLRTMDTSNIDLAWSAAGWYSSRRYEARVGIAFDTESECALLEDWARTAFITALTSIGGPAGNMGTWFDSQLPAELAAGSLLGQGALIVRYNANARQPWSVYWEIRLDGRPAGHMTLVGTEYLASGPVPDGSQWQSARSTIWDVLGAADTYLPAVNASVPEHVVASYSRVISNFEAINLLDADHPVDLMSRDPGIDPKPFAFTRLEPLLKPYAPARDHVPFASVVDHLLSRGLAGLLNRRVPARRTTRLEELAAPIALVDGGGTGVELLRLKNGDASDRRRFTHVQDLFCELTSRRIDVRQEVLNFTEENVSSDQITASPVVMDKHPQTGLEVDVPLHLAGAGLEDIALLSLLLTDASSVLVLDEPAPNVSPVVQRRFLKVLLERRADLQTILITHSAHLVPMRSSDDLAAVIRLDRNAHTSLTHRVDAPAALFQAARGLLSEAAIRDLLFAAGAVLVEGPTELAALREWLSNGDALNGLPTPEEAHVVLTCVHGDTQFAKYARLLEAFAIPWTILADGPAFAHRGPLSRLPNPAPPSTGPVAEPFVECTNRWADFKVRTLADSYGTDGSKSGEIEAFFARIDQNLWDQVCAESDARHGKTHRGRRFAGLVETPSEIVDLWSDQLNDLGLTARGA